MAEQVSVPATKPADRPAVMPADDAGGDAVSSRPSPPAPRDMPYFDPAATALCRGERRTITEARALHQRLIADVQAAADPESAIKLTELAAYARLLLAGGTPSGETPMGDDPSLLHQTYRIAMRAKSKRNRLNAVQVLAGISRAGSEAPLIAIGGGMTRDQAMELVERLGPVVIAESRRAELTATVDSGGADDGD